MYKRKKKFWAKHWDFITLDTIAALLAMIVALFIRFHRVVVSDVLPHEYIYENILVMIVFVSILNCSLRDPYTGIIHRNKWQELMAVIVHSFFNLCGIVLFLYAFKYAGSVSREALFTWAGLMVVFMFVFRIVFQRVIRYRKMDDINKSSMLIIADSSTIKHCLAQLVSSEYVEYKVVGCAIIDKNWVQ